METLSQKDAHKTEELEKMSHLVNKFKQLMDFQENEKL